MTPDEYEGRLRDAVLCYYNALPCISTAHGHGDGIADDLDAYRDFIRLRTQQDFYDGLFYALFEKGDEVCPSWLSFARSQIKREIEALIGGNDEWQRRRHAPSRADRRW